jgi:hypothetical protein
MSCTPENRFSETDGYPVFLPTDGKARGFDVDIPPRPEDLARRIEGIRLAAGETK